MREGGLVLKLAPLIKHHQKHQWAPIPFKNTPQVMNIPVSDTPSPPSSSAKSILNVPIDTIVLPVTPHVLISNVLTKYYTISESNSSKDSPIYIPNDEDYLRLQTLDTMRTAFTSLRSASLQIDTRNRHSKQLLMISNPESFKVVTHEVTVCAWLLDDTEPESCKFQGDFIWPNFVLKASVLGDVGLDLVPDKPWFKVYNCTQKLWEKVIHQTTHTHSPISVSSLSPSPAKVLELTDSDGEASFNTPLAHRHYHPVSATDFLSSPPSIKQEAPTSTPAKKKWPSDYHVVDVAHILDACRFPPSGKTIAQIFESIVAQKFVQSSTYYDAKGQWDVASQEDRDLFEGFGYNPGGLWSAFAAHVPLKNAPLCAARQRQAHHA
ncbi:hypothetical protein BYT27DRAFT_7260784 [Phlegmacium glaucopus]|nr:hypothetical protein BYT27DRAFT_7260784 [Phlegmacium glaucopus]